MVLNAGIKRKGAQKGGAGVAAKRIAFGQGSAPQGGLMGEVRFDNPAHVQNALGLNGSELLGNIISVELHPKSSDNSKVIIGNIPHGAEWQELKDHFKTCGQVAHADVKGMSVGSVRYGSAEEAATAMSMFDGADLMGSTLQVRQHPGSKDSTKLQVFGIPGGAEWQELKDFFGTAGTVVFADVASSGGNQKGEIRYDNPVHTQMALAQLDGSMLGGATIKVTLDQNSTDGSKLCVTGIPSGIEWQELKDHFAPIGTVAFANVHGGKGKGKGKGGKGGGFSKGGGFGGGGLGGGQLGQLAGLLGNLGGGGGGGLNSGVKNQLLQLLGGALGGGGAGLGGGPMAAEVRYDDPLCTQLAVTLLNGSDFNGKKLKVAYDQMSQDGTKLSVTNVPPGTGWQDLKDHFAQIAPVAFCNVKAAGAKGKGKGKF